MDKPFITRLKVRSTKDPLFATVARMVNPPEADEAKACFLPAYGGFDIAEGTQVDISFLYQPPSERPWLQLKSGFDRHWRTEELWIVTGADFYLPLAPARYADDRDELPHLEDMLCFAIKQGDLFVLKPNVWHTGPWAVKPGQAVQFYMLLSGHRQAVSGGYLDLGVRNFAGAAAVLPDVDDSGRPLS